MATIDVKCPFCEQTEPVKNMDREAPVISASAVRPAVEVFSLSMNIVPVSRV